MFFSLKVYIVVYVCFICVSSRDCGPQLPSVDQHWSVFRDGHVGDERLVLLLDPRHTTPTLQFQLKSGCGLLERNLPPRLVYSASLSFQLHALASFYIRVFFIKTSHHFVGIHNVKHITVFRITYRSITMLNLLPASMMVFSA